MPKLRLRRGFTTFTKADDWRRAMIEMRSQSPYTSSTYIIHFLELQHAKIWMEILIHDQNGIPVHRAPLILPMHTSSTSL